MNTCRLKQFEVNFVMFRHFLGNELSHELHDVYVVYSDQNERSF